MVNTGIVVTVLGIRRVYSRVYSRESIFIPRMVEHYRQKEAEEARENGYRVTGVIESAESTSHHRLFLFEYEAA